MAFFLILSRRRRKLMTLWIDRSWRGRHGPADQPAFQSKLGRSTELDPVKSWIGTTSISRIRLVGVLVGGDCELPHTITRLAQVPIPPCCAVWPLVDPHPPNDVFLRLPNDMNSESVSQCDS